ncbi:MAG TPA: adenylyl-sulfate kinase, partial [Lacipirellulaceae bacterium]|nr:adenylyl-sulfate kinase [Lacipirellulaceae bacterium]
DVAYRYFSTATRKFIIADCPGHEQYTRNLATGASTCDLAIILIDARHGVMTQTKRHSFIVSLLGIKHVLVAVNKMDLVDYREDAYEQIKRDYRDFAARLDLVDQHFIPLSALKGDNLVDKSPNMPWYDGSTLMHHLENVHIASDRNLIDFRFPVQYVNRPNLDFRGFCGTVASGRIRKGETVMSLPSRKTSRVKSIVTYDGDIEEAFAPQSVTLTLTDEIDVSRGDMLVRPDNVPTMADAFDATIVWMADEPLQPGKQYWFKQTSKLAAGSVSNLRYRIDVNTLHRQDAEHLALNEIGRCHVRLNQPIAFDGYRQNKGTGAFIVIDRMTNVTVGAGMILARTAAETSDRWQEQAPEGLQSELSTVTPAEREGRFGQKPATVLLTGLAGAGKTTTAYALERKLFDLGRAVCVLDGQNIRRGISRDLNFSSDDRSENLRRSAEAAKLLNDAGLIVLAAFLAPEEAVRQKAADVVGRDRFLVVHLDAPIEVCRARDAEGMYAKADQGEIAKFPGVGAPYEAPAKPDLVLNTAELPVDECVKRIVKLLADRAIATA